MKLINNTKSTRRQFVLGSGALAAISSLPLSLQAKTDLQSMPSKQGIVAYREDDERSSAFAAVMAEAGMTLLPLAKDPVRQWRDEARAAVENLKLPMIGLTNWSDYLLMRELNGELRRKPESEEMCFVSAQEDKVEWAVNHAMKILEHNSSLEQVPEFEIQHLGHGHLFSWTIS